jgi:hypothetical protein
MPHRTPAKDETGAAAGAARRVGCLDIGH